MSAPEDDLVDRCTDAITRLREVLPLAEQIDTVVNDIFPGKPDKRRRRQDPVDVALYEALKGLPTDMADSFQDAIDRLETALETAQEDAKAKARAELEEAEERVRELRRRLEEEPGNASGEAG